MAEGWEKRKFPRAALPCHVRYRRIPISPKGPRNASVRDVSEGGLRFRTTELLHRGSNILVELYLPGGVPVRSLASIAWVRAMPGDEDFEIGGSFVEPTHDARTTLAQHLGGALAAPPPAVA